MSCHARFVSVRGRAFFVLYHHLRIGVLRDCLSRVFACSRLFPVNGGCDRFLLVATGDFNRDFKRNCAHLRHLRAVTLENGAKNERNCARVCRLRAVTLVFASIVRWPCDGCVIVA